MMKIAIAGMGYVGLSLACLLAQDNTVQAVDVVPEKVDLINRGLSPITDSEIEKALASGKLDLQATCDAAKAYQDADYIVVATPTDYDSEGGSFDTSSVEAVLSLVDTLGIDATLVIKSTIPVGYTAAINARFKQDILFSPEFLREGHALYDNLHPSRIIVGFPEDQGALRHKATEFAELLKAAALGHDLHSAPNNEVDQIPVLVMGSTEAEAVKLFANTYLALRVSYFNELDTFAALQNLDSQQIIKGVCLDPRIGDYYNNPSFGYGGYCLPKDTKQLLANYEEVPQNLIRAVVDANDTRKGFIAKQIIDKRPQSVGVFRLVMKKDSDNLRQSSIHDVMDRLLDEGVKVLIFEPLLQGESYKGCPIIRDIDEFKQQSDLIICNRMNEEIRDVSSKVYTRDIWNMD